jgi:hypothetical protein
MYKSAAEYLQLNRPIPTKPEYYNSSKQPILVSQTYPSTYSKPSSTKFYNPNQRSERSISQSPRNESKNESGLEMIWETKNYTNTFNPAVFGPPLWFSFHNMAASYPTNPSPIVKDRMKGVIQGIPYMLTCDSCFHHATGYIENSYDRLDSIVSTRNNLVKFFVDFHNFVNKRLGKRTYTVSEAERMYGNNVTVKTLTFGKK